MVCLFVCIWGHLLWRRGQIEGPRSIPNMTCQLQVVAGIILAASPRCFPYTITKSAMRDTAVGIWSALERRNWGRHCPGWTTRVRKGAMLTTGLVQTLLGHQISSRWTPAHRGICPQDHFKWCNFTSKIDLNYFRAPGVKQGVKWSKKLQGIWIFGFQPLFFSQNWIIFKNV